MAKREGQCVRLKCCRFIGWLCAKSPHGTVYERRVFGSVLHKSDTEASDLDLLVDAAPGATLMDLAALQVEAEALLGLPVDVLTAPFLPSSFRERVMSEAEPL